MSKDVIDLKARAQQRDELQQSSGQIMALQGDINTLVKENYDQVDHTVIGTAFLHYAARVGCQLGMNSKQFSLAAKEAFKEVAKELRG